MRRASARASLAIGLAGAIILLSGCGTAASTSAVPVPTASVGPAATVTPAVAQTRIAIVETFTAAGVNVQLGDATQPYRPAESARLRSAPRAVFQVTLPDQPNAGYIVVYDFPDAASAVDAGNEEAGYLGTGPAKVQFPPDAEHVLQAVGTTLVLYTWSPTASSDPTAGNVADALKRLGIGFSIPR